ncbi:DUF2510 domain-containing protein [Nocardia nova]|uniref:DUF2510 domain-containing protein n=1 Tax=Nocardia nova TaxID=37330 RepID=UPI003718B447
MSLVPVAYPGGWYPDPGVQGLLRYRDGRQWTDTWSRGNRMWRAARLRSQRRTSPDL